MADAWINLGRILDDHGGHETAVQCYDIALEIEPQDHVAWSNRGNSLRALGKTRDAAESYRQALAIEADDLAARVGLGPCLIAEGQVDEGLQMLDAVIQSTEHPLPRFEKATALAQQGRYPEALALYDEVIAQGFQSAELFNNHAECLAKETRIDESLASFDRALALDDSFAPAYFGKARVLSQAGRQEEARPVVEMLLQVADDDLKASPAVQALRNLVQL